MRLLNCRKCGKKLIDLEKGVIVKSGVVAYCVNCDPAKKQDEPIDFPELFRSLGDKAR